MINRGLETWLCYSLGVFVMMLPISIAVVQPPAYLASVLSLFLLWKYRHEPVLRSPFTWLVLIFLGMVMISAALGVRPEKSFNKINRFVILGLIWSIPFIFADRLRDGSRSIEKLLVLFMVGMVIKAAYDFVRVPTAMGFGVSLYETGNMRDPQFYLTAICLASGMIITKGWHLKYLPTLAGLLMSVGGMIIHFKRGAWAAVLGGLAVMAVASRRWRPLGIAGLLLLSLAVIPSVRERLWQLQREFNPEHGGRLLLWTEVAPVIIPQHPIGMGWKAVTHEDFVAITDKVEPGLNHLHNNFLQVTLELGWVGLLIWMVWMGYVIVMFWRSYRALATAGDFKMAGISLGGLGAFSGLMLNGLVEYNFGDSEIFMMMVFLMGLAAAVHRKATLLRTRTPAT